MDIDFNNQNHDFRPWQPELGRVYQSGFAFDTETTLIDDARPYLTPAYVIGAVFDGQRGFFFSYSGRMLPVSSPLTRGSPSPSTTPPLTSA